MAKKKSQKKKEKTQLANRSLRVPPIGIIDNVVISKTEAWAYYILADKPYSFLSTPALIGLANNTSSALAGLCQSADKKIDCHLLITNQMFHPESWYEQLVEMNKKYYNGIRSKPKDPMVFRKFVEEQAESLYKEGYRKRMTFLGVKLFSRGSFDISSFNPLEFGMSEAVNAFKKSVSGIFQFNSTEITAHEEKRIREAEKEIYRILATSDLNAIRPTAEDCLLTIKRRFYPAMPVPYLETDHETRVGLSDIVIETGGTIKVEPRWLKFTQAIDEDIYEAYRTTLSFSKFPREMIFPDTMTQFLHKPSMLPFTVNARFTLIPTEYMKKTLSRKKLDAEDEIENLAQSGQRVTARLRDTMSDISQLESDLETTKHPWVSGSYRITIETGSLDNLKTIVSELKQDYASSDFVLTWTTGDQLELFREEFLGGKLEISDFNQTTNLSLIGISGMNYGENVGDPVKQNIKFKRRG